jgi:hypothetical protein
VSYADRLIHTLSVVRQVDTGSKDDYGQPITTPTTRSVSGLPQPKRVREVAAIHESGASIGSWTIFLLMDDVIESDSIDHVAATCPVTDDLPDMHWNITGVRNAAGLGHHLEVDASVVGGPALEVAAS